MLRSTFKRPCTRLLSHTAASHTAAGAAAADGEDEVERKFRLAPAVRASLAARLRAAPPAARSCFTDRYFDARDFALTRRDLWLRRRDAVWELKAPQPPAAAAANAPPASLAGVDFYRESRDWPTIAAEATRLAGVRLSPPFPAPGDDSSASAAETWLAACGVELFANVRTQRERHSLELERGHSVRIDLDDVAFLATGNDALQGQGGPRELSRYEIGEIELVAAGGGMSPSAALADAFGQLGIDTAPVRGKLLELLVRHRPEHYEALRASGLLAAKLGPEEGRGAAARKEGR